MIGWVTISALAAFAIAASLTPLLRRIGHRFGLAAPPDPLVKRHTRPVPLLGGAAILAGIAPTIVACSLRDHRLALIGVAVLIVAVLGASKDWVGHNVSPFGQMTVQLLAVCTLLYATDPLQLTNSTVANVVASSLVCIWIINGWNFLDVLDGLAVGSAAIAACCFALGNLLVGNTDTALLSAALMGSLAGFLLFNYPPATIFMGDLGSFPLGMLFCSLLLTSAAATPSSSAPAFGLLLFLPMGDVFATAMTRVVAGRSPFRGHSPDHLALRLTMHGWSDRSVISLAYGVGAVAGLLGLLILWVSGLE